MEESPLKVGGKLKVMASSRVRERVDLEKEKDALALENARLANENMVLQNERLAQENAALRMQAQGPMMQLPMDPTQQWWAGMNPWGMPPAACSSFGYTQEANDLTSRANELSRQASELRARANGKGGSKGGSKNEPSGDSEGSGLLDSFGSGTTSYGPGSMSSTTSQKSWVSASEETDASASVPLHLRTTVMMRNIPSSYTREMLLELVNRKGFTGSYDLVYLPIDFQNNASNLGYSFINFVDAEVANRFHKQFDGFCQWTIESCSLKVCEVTWSDAMQGIDAHVERYRNSPVMHKSVPDECKPVLFQEGERIPFPEPTKIVRPPRQWQRVHRVNGNGTADAAPSLSFTP